VSLVNNFGITDVLTPGGDQLFAHIYKEGDGKKGSNNVASFVLKTLDKWGLLDQEKGIRNELNQVFDNCPGQNKNNHVLHLVPYLVELVYFI
jgi:hypothetical protein